MSAVRGAGGWYDFSFPGLAQVGLVASHTACPGERSTVVLPAHVWLRKVLRAPGSLGRGNRATTQPLTLGGSTAGSQAGLARRWGPASAGLCTESPGHMEPQPGSTGGRGHVPLQVGPCSSLSALSWCPVGWAAGCTPQRAGRATSSFLWGMTQGQQGSCLETN